jgi:hypothetical protein
LSGSRYVSAYGSWGDGDMRGMLGWEFYSGVKNDGFCDKNKMSKRKKTKYG